MGRAKQAMMEYEEHEWEGAPVTFTCPECGKLSDGEAELPRIVDHHEYELNIGIDVECIWCGEDFSAEFIKSASDCKIIFYDHPKTEVEFEPVALFSRFVVHLFNLVIDDNLPVWQFAFSKVSRTCCGNAPIKATSSLSKF